MLPSTLIHIGNKAFYRCSALTSIRIPEMVAQFGTGVFAYCSSLVQAIVEAQITELPVWTFYECTSLVNVVLPQNVTNVGEYAFYHCDNLQNTSYEKAEDTNSSTAVTLTQNPEGNFIKTDKQVIEKENASINISVQQSKHPDDNQVVHNVQIEATINGKEGLDEFLNETGNYATYTERLENSTTQIEAVDVVIRLNNTSEIVAEVLEKYAGKNVNLTLVTEQNTKWVINCKTINKEALAETYNLEYKIVKNVEPTDAQKGLIGEAASYLITFSEEIPFDVTVMVRLGIPFSRKVASFCNQTEKKAGVNYHVLLVRGS